jgi:hypothetical protein
MILAAFSAYQDQQALTLIFTAIGLVMLAYGFISLVLFCKLHSPALLYLVLILNLCRREFDACQRQCEWCLQDFDPQVQRGNDCCSESY